MARRGALAQQLNAIESLASVDAICLDKTGTLTDARLQVELLVPAAGVEEGELAHELGRYAASAHSRNATLEAIDEHCGGAAEEPQASVPFSSRRRWSALQLGPTTYLLGAPELFPANELQVVAEREARAGRRVVAFGTARGRVDADSSPRHRRATRARRPRRAPARRCARDDRVPPVAGCSRAGHLR
jgi:P-type E1-E2 ATPase